ncbi:MAG: cshA-B, partial [Chlamydiales bacterium]|nr:cshA-B [Chlamydiales bacterium]
MTIDETAILEVEPAISTLTFSSFGLKDSILKAIESAGFKTPSVIQEQVIPVILEGKDVVAQSQTGTGKTAAFGLPALHRILENPNSRMLVITPTRELAQQVSDEIYRYGSFAGIKTATVQGGQSFTRQLDFINRGAQVVVATPGRLLDLYQSNRLGQFKPSIIVLDEADEMLDMGFLEDIQSIFTFLPEERQTLLFSATMPPAIQNLAKRILKEPVFVKVTPKETTNKDIRQIYYVIRETERDDAIIRLINCHDPVKSIIFCKTKKDVERLSTVLIKEGYMAKGLHGDMEQAQRQQVIGSFRTGGIDMLVATDVAARGLSIPDVSHVFNFHIPFDAESYVHRIGRTGRAGKKGIAVTLLTLPELKDLNRVLKSQNSQAEQCFIPTMHEVRNNKIARLLEDLKSHDSSDEAKTILALLQREMNSQEINLTLISYLLTQQQVSGPDHLGVSAQEMERYQSKSYV